MGSEAAATVAMLGLSRQTEGSSRPPHQSTHPPHVSPASRNVCLTLLAPKHTTWSQAHYFTPEHYLVPSTLLYPPSHYFAVRTPRKVR